jgi:hypothetical protein
MKNKNISTKSWQALRNFGAYWHEQGKFQWFYQTIAIVPCHIKYFMKDNERTVNTNVQLSHEGEVGLWESEWLNAIDHYTVFNSRFQIYSVTPDYALRIEGNGPKINGDYWIEITPS